MFKKLWNWWQTRPLGYSELHVPAEASVDEVKEIILTQFAHRLPQDRRARAFRVRFLLDDHCQWQKMTRASTQRPHITQTTCRRCKRCGSKIS